MQSPIRLITSGGVLLDVDPSSTVEINMGVIIISDLSTRTTSYTNSFKLPRTPNNDKVFGYASQLTRYNLPVINCVIEAGFFYRSNAVIRMLSSDSRYYNCSLSIDTPIDLKSMKIWDLFDSATLQTVIYKSSSGATLAELISKEHANDPHFYVLGDGYLVPSAIVDDTDAKKDPRGLFIMLSDLLDLLEAEHGITFAGAVLTNSDFLNLAILNPFVKRQFDDDGLGSSSIVYNLKFKTEKAEEN